MTKRIPFNRVYFTGRELDYIQTAVDSNHLSGDGPYTKKSQAFLEQHLGAKKALLTTSCTDALEMSAILCDFQPGDEVIVPSFTFVSTVNAFVLRGAKPVFCDIRADTLNLDEKLLERKITKKTKAVVVVHYAGIACEMEKIVEICQRRNITLIEDNAHGLFAKYRGKHLGTFGQMATQSFHETKNIICGEGGALLLNDEKLLDRAEIIREKGTDRSKFFRGQVDKYSWVDIGSSFLPSDMLAAFLYAQLEFSQKIQESRKSLWTFYDSGLREWATANGVGLPTVPDHCDQSYHMYYLVMPTLEARSQFIRFLASHEVGSVFHYLPLHLSKMGRTYGGKPGQCPVTESISDRLVRLPFFAFMEKSDRNRVVEVVTQFQQAVRKAA